MSEIRHHRPQQRLGLHVPPRYDLHHNKKLQHARLTTRTTCARNRFGTSVPLAKKQNMFQSRSRPCFKHAMRNTTRTQLKCATPHLMADNDGILKARCMSEIWHHKPQQISCQSVPCRSTSILDRNLKDWRTTTLRTSQRSDRLERSVASRSGSNT